MSEASAKILLLERRVMWRKRLLSLQDALAIAVLISGLIGAVIVSIVRLRPIAMPVWPLVIATMSLSFGAALSRWFSTRAGETDAAFLIDESLELDDRIATSRLIIQRGGPASAVEEALIEDAAARLGNQQAAAVVPFRTHRWYALPLVAVIALLGSLLIPARSLPVNQALAAERAAIESAGQQLEETSAEIEQTLTPGTETATLAKEQAEIGRGFRRANSTRAEALRRLSALGERISKRHSDLENTRAEEIVSLADRRLSSALSPSTPQRKQKEVDDSLLAPQTEQPSETSKTRTAREARATGANRSNPSGSPAQTEIKAEQQRGELAKTDESKQQQSQKRRQEQVSGKDHRKTDSLDTKSIDSNANNAKAAAGEPDRTANQKPNNQKPGETAPVEPNANAQKSADQSERKADGQPTADLPEGAVEALKAVPDSLVQQSAKALPKMSAELLKKAAQLRARELSPADIERLRKAAESLARDLAKIEQSKELQKALEEMARQTDPQRIEQVARELDNQEELKQELEAAGRLLSENLQAKEMVAGLDGQLARMQEERRQRGDNSRGTSKANVGGEESGGGNRALRSNRDDPGKMTAERKITGEGRESALKGTLRQGSGGEYLFLQSKAGAGAARAPYSSAYPQYRREAERTVQRSKVPANLRSVVRKYFNAINPDAKRP